MSSPLVPREATRAALRGLRLSPEEREAALEGSHPEVKRLIGGEVDAIQWVAALFTVWHEHGVLREVVEYLREYVKQTGDEQRAA